MRPLALAAVLLLAGCQSATIVSEHHVVVTPPDELYSCQVVKFPDYRNLMDSQVAQLLVDLHRANVTCATSLEAVRSYLEKAKETVN